MFTMSVQSDDPAEIARVLRWELSMLEGSDVFHRATANPAREACTAYGVTTEATPATTVVFMPSGDHCEGTCDCRCFD